MNAHGVDLVPTIASDQRGVEPCQTSDRIEIGPRARRKPHQQGHGNCSECEAQPEHGLLAGNQDPPRANLRWIVSGVLTQDN